MLHLDPFAIPAGSLRPGDAVFCHDIGPLTDPDLFDPETGAAYADVYREIAEVGPHIVFLSHAARKVLEARFPAARPASVRVIPPVMRIGVAGEAVAMPRLGDRFLLTVGGAGARGNQARCIAAFERSGLAQRGWHYVLCGGPEPGFDKVADLAARTAGVELLPYVSAGEMAWLHRTASGFVLASRFEGPFTPLAEAIARGLLPIVTRGGALEEVAGPGAMLVDAQDEVAIAVAMTQLCDMDDGERALRLAELGASIGRYGFEEFARGWLALVDDMLAVPLLRVG